MIVRLLRHVFVHISIVIVLHCIKCFAPKIKKNKNNLWSLTPLKKKLMYPLEMLHGLKRIPESEEKLEADLHDFINMQVWLK